MAAILKDPTMSNLKNTLRGVFGFPVTPFKNDLSLDLEGLEANVAGMIQHPYCAVVAAGGTGEIYSMSVDEAVEVVRTTVRVVNGRMPVVAGVGYNTPMGAEMARRMEQAGADALLVMPPYYSNAPEAGLFDYYETIGRASGLPLALYSRDWAVFSPNQVARLCDRVPTLQIWKDGQGNIRTYQRIMQQVGDRLAWVGGLGDDCAPGYFAIGVQAYTSSISNISAKVSLALAEAGLARDFATMNTLMEKYVHPLYSIRERVKGYEVSVMKLLMDELGFRGGPVRPPLCAVRPEHVDDVKRLADTYR
ncbi:MAG: 5-dehydro-4-deoxyglucarate dehydratase [Acidobacteria bacterium]|nr:5-dehydro-4-deoxyglucarate dehydratase [Acidobacteriota bacterium]